MVSTNTQNESAKWMIDEAPLAMMIIDPVNDCLIAANFSAQRMLSIQGNHPLLETPFSHRLSASLALWINFTNEVLNQSFGWSDDLIIFDIKRQPHNVEVYAKTVGHECWLLLTLIDRNESEHRRAKAELSRQHRIGEVGWQRVEKVFERIEKQNHLILSAAGEGIYGLDADGKTTFANPAAERILGWTAQDMVGHDAHIMFHHSHADGKHYPVKHCPIHASFCDGQVHRVENEVFWHKNGEAISVEYTSTPIFEMGRLVGAVVLFRDISKRLIAEQQLRDALVEVESLKKRLELENQYLQEEIKAELDHQNIIGKSPALKKLLQQIEMVSPTDANVLITGESGTGKELIARAIHASSQRSERPLIRVNCAAIPRELFESEFFGHVKGAFTGAIRDRSGRFELADGGTLFLDEIGEIPIELQSKLLRVLQDQQIERVGDNRTMEVDVRVIAATNRDLRSMIEAGQFREDLYFRLHVFPLESIPLRQRKEDIPLLADFFLRRACKKFNKPFTNISSEQARTLQFYPWPGNIRELENVIERQVIVTSTGNITFDDLFESVPSTPWTHSSKKSSDSNQDSTIISDAIKILSEKNADFLTEKMLLECQRTSALMALKHSRGKVSGPDGAAIKLGLRPTTLASRLRKWGINPDNLS